MEREQTWIRAIQRRNSREAAEQLIQTYYDEIYRFVYRQTGKGDYEEPDCRKREKWNRYLADV